MRRVPVLLAAVIALWVPRLAAQAPVPGAYPHLVLTDGSSQTVPGPGGPFDNTGVFQAFSGLAFEAQITYQSAGQPNTNVVWALLISPFKSPLPTNTIPPQLLLLPPFIMVQAASATLDGSGFGKLALVVPAGLYSAQSYVQALAYDVTSTPHVRLTNGLTLKVAVPDFNVRFNFVRSQPNGGPGQLRDVGTTDLGPSELKQLQPIGPNTAPLAVADAAPLDDDFRFLPIAPNAGDEPINPRARPVTRIAGSVDGTTTTITVQDTSFFPKRGRLLMPFNDQTTTNLWAKKAGGGESVPPACEVVTYDGLTPTSFLNCKRGQLGSRGSQAPFVHVDGQVVLGFWTEATTAGAATRQRVGLDADNIDMPHVVIPAFTFDGGEGTGVVTRDIDLYIYETVNTQRQGFMTFDRVTGTWRRIPGTEFPATSGVWEPMITIAPDGRSCVAVLAVPGGVFDWENKPNRLFAIRLDGLHWPASNAEAWELLYQLEPDPKDTFEFQVRGRRPFAPAMAIVGGSPENYVLYAGLAHKWRVSSPAGQFWKLNIGFEFEYVSEDVVVRDLIECPLIPPGSSKLPPSMPRPYITTQFGNTGIGGAIFRFDPELLPSPDRTRLLLAAGPTNAEEDVFCIRNIGVLANGTVSRTLANVSGYSLASTSAGKSEVRPFAVGGHGQGRRAAFSPDGTKVAWLTRNRGTTQSTDQDKDWIDIAFTSGASFGKVKHTYATTVGTVTFKIAGPMQTTDRAVLGLRFLDNNRLVFMMGRSPYTDPAGLVANATPPGMDLFLYDISADLMTNLTRTDGTSTGFGLGKIVPAGFLASADNSFVYVLRTGKLAVAAPGDVHVMNVLGLNAASGNVFSLTGTEFGGGLIPDLDVPATEVVSPIESPAAMRLVEGTGAQAGMIYWTSHYAGGNGGDNLFAFNRTTPFVAFACTDVATPGVHLNNITPDPSGGKVAFSRTDTTDRYASNQHPFVVDLDNFLFERDLTPTWMAGGGFLGRVMDGSFHFIPPVGTAGEALVFAFGLNVLPSTGSGAGIAMNSMPVYYPLAAVSDLLAEPVPVLIPMVNTGLLGSDWRFYIPAAGPSQDN